MEIDLIRKLKEAAEEIQKLREDLSHAGKLADMGQTMAAVVHELKQPLLGIKSFTQMMLEEMPSDDPSRRRAGAILEQSLVMERMLGRLSDFSRSSDALNHDMDINEAVKGALDLFEYRTRKPNIHVDSRLKEGIPRVKGDAGNIRQVFVNILNNALDAVEPLDKGRIEIRSSYWPEGRFAQVTIANNGTPIPRELREKIFDPFFTTKRGKGTGLGLYICREIIKLHKGRLTLICPEEARDGLVTVFRVELPSLST